MNRHIRKQMNDYNFPSYRRIPIAAIAEKQEEYLSCGSRETEKDEHDYIEERDKLTPLPVLKLIKVQEQANTYKVELDNLQNKTEIQEQEQIIYKNEEQIKVQQSIINQNMRTFEEHSLMMRKNEQAIQEQLNSINIGNQKIIELNNHIQAQHGAYNHNNMILQNQVQQVYQLYSEIGNYQEKLYNLQKELQEKEKELETIKADVETYQQNADYHQTMISSYNNLIQNPEYFSQLMMSTMMAAGMGAQFGQPANPT